MTIEEFKNTIGVYIFLLKPYMNEEKYKECKAFILKDLSYLDKYQKEESNNGNK